MLYAFRGGGFGEAGDAGLSIGAESHGLLLFAYRVMSSVFVFFFYLLGLGGS